MLPDLFSSSLGTNRKEEKSSSLQEILSNLSPFDGYVLGIITAGSAFLAFHRFGRRIKNSEWVHGQHLSKKQWIKGVVTRWVQHVEIGTSCDVPD
jgi:hypothetical protein